MNDDIKKLLQLYFPSLSYSSDELTEKIERGEILTNQEEILPYLQTALLDEKILEVELDKMPSLYFSRLQDHNPAPETEEDDILQPTYNPGDYLLSLDHIITLPLEPGLGSLRLRQSTSVILRMFTKEYGIEMGTTFKNITRINELPVLQLAYPSILRIEKNAREFRAKVPDHQDFVVEVERENGPLELTTNPIDISRKGMGISIDKHVHRQLQLEDELFLKLYIDDELRARISSTVRHLSKVRKRHGIEYCCGVEFSLNSRTITSVMESIVASTQRAHLKELAEIAASRGIDLLL
ncbi:PilZ domain-containing protein [Desulforhopalus sp. 52FAK]